MLNSEYEFIIETYFRAKAGENVATKVLKRHPHLLRSEVNEKIKQIKKLLLDD